MFLLRIVPKVLARSILFFLLFLLLFLSLRSKSSGSDFFGLGFVFWIFVGDYKTSTMAHFMAPLWVDDSWLVFFFLMIIFLDILANLLSAFPNV